MIGEDRKKNNMQVGKLLEQYVLRRGVCSVSGSIYDTAWVSMVSKYVDGRVRWLFPESFECICSLQSESGGWEGGDPVDVIVNTLASLLAMKRHLKVEDSTPDADLPQRITNATDFLAHRLSELDSCMTDGPAFEVLIPSMLDLLEIEGVQLRFPECDRLREINQRRMGKVNFSALYDNPESILHSLESFIGLVDFDRLGEHLRDGGMMGSPASTAAYLMNASRWDKAAEGYLKEAVENGRRIANGMVTTVFPMSTFEFAWSTCNILENGLEVEEVHRERIGKILISYLEEGNGAIGFDPCVAPDADDTAKALTALHLLGYTVPYNTLMEKFEMESYFRGDATERTPSFCANCNVLLALLHAPSPKRYISQILKCVRYICYTWWNTDEPIIDKWNLSPIYPALLASQSLIRLLHLYETSLIDVPEQLLKVKVMIVLFQILARTLQLQNQDGSWGKTANREETAYALITLANVDSLPFVTPIAGQIESAISKGRKYLKSNGALESTNLTPSDYMWRGKIAYGVENVSHSYILAALNTPVPQFLLGPRVSNLVNIPVKRLGTFAKFYAKLPMFSKIDMWRLKAWLIEGYLFLPDLERMKLGVFNRVLIDDDKYFEYLPFSWTAPNGLEHIHCGAQTLYDMMLLSLLNYQVDQLFDGVVVRGDMSVVGQLRENIEKLCSKQRNARTSRDLANGPSRQPLIQDDEDLYQQLQQFIDYVLKYPRIQSARPIEKSNLLHELKAYLLAQTQQCEDGIKLRRQNFPKIYTNPPSTYSRWIRNTGADYLSSQYAFAFLSCLVSSGAENGPSSDIRYIAQDCCSRLSVVCRLFNDFGSVERDRKESNLNSLMFPEFEGDEKSESELRQELIRLTKYERKCLATSFEELKRACGQRHQRLYEMTRLFYNASEIYTEVYEVRDLSKWM